MYYVRYADLPNVRTGLKTSKTSETYKSLKTDLMNGRFKPGAQLRIDAMSKSLDYTPGFPPNPCPDCYSNFGYQILGRVVEKVSGQTYENYVRNVIMAPAGVTRTRAARSYDSQRAPGELDFCRQSNASRPNATAALSGCMNSRLVTGHSAAHATKAASRPVAASEANRAGHQQQTAASVKIMRVRLMMPAINRAPAASGARVAGNWSKTGTGP